MNKKFRKLDNIAKLFSLDEKKEKNIFGYSVVLKENINKNILKIAIDITMEKYEAFKVKMSKGIFWNYLEENKKKVLIKKNNKNSYDEINTNENNNFLFKITYYKNRINLNIFHVLTDGVGAISFLKSIIYNYLNIKHNLSHIENTDMINVKDQYIKRYNKKYREKFDFKKAFILPQKKNYLLDNIHYYTVNMNEIKKVSRYYNVTITEYLTALYIYSIYLSFYNNKTKNEIVVAIPINLRKYYNTNTLSNFFSCMNINPGIIKNKLHTFEEVLTSVVNEFKNKLNNTKIKQYLTRDVKMGKSIPISLIPLNIKKFTMKYFGNMFYSNTTTTLSNIGKIDIDDQYIKYIDNIYLESKPWKFQKMKCSICSYDTKLNITINSNINDIYFEQVFYNLLKKDIKNIKTFRSVLLN